MLKLIFGLAFLSTTFIVGPDGLSAQPQFDRHTIDKDLKAAYWVQAIDMDADGDLDLVTASYQGVDWWENTALSFTKNFIGSFRGSWAVYAADVDVDGDIDVMGASSAEDEFSYWQRKGRYSFSETSLGASLGPESIAAADLDDDGDLDIVGAAWADGQIIWWKNNGKAGFERKLVDADLRNAHSVHTGDLDNDGVPDVVACGVGGTRWYRYDGNGNFVKKTVHRKGGWSVYVADMDNDGDQDFLRTQRDNGDVVLFRNDGSGGFSSQVIEAGFGECWSIAAGDIDGDGWPDIAGAGFAANQIRVWLNDGSGDFGEGIVVDSVSEPRSVFIADLDADGDGDVAAAIRGDRDLVWYEVVGVPKSITILSPRSDDELFGRASYSITWEFTGAIDAVNIEFSQDAGATWSTIAADISNDGQYNWQVPDIASDACAIRVSDATDARFSGMSDVFTISLSSLTLVSPNGAENWVAGEEQTIRWTTVGSVDSVSLYYSLDDGSNWIAIAEKVTNEGSFLWTIPDTTSNNSLVRVSDVTDGQPTDQSDALFSLKGSTLVLETPNGGESWLEGTTHLIRWTTQGLVDSVTLEYTLNSGENWVLITNSTKNDGSYSWELPYTSSSMCFVRISDHEDNQPSDLSDDTFSIRSSMISLLSPNGDEDWLGGTVQSIEWRSDAVIDSVGLEYSVDLGLNWLEIISSTPDDGKFDWRIPDILSDSCQVRVIRVGNSNPFDTSDRPFSISPSRIMLESPNGGETWLAGSTREIRWVTEGRVDSVRIEYSLDNGSNWMTVHERLPNSGSSSWLVPNLTSDSCLIRVSDTFDSMPVAVSQKVFSVDVVSSVSDDDVLPRDYRVYQNFPNPFNLQTKISYELPRESKVNITVYDLLGRQVRRLVDRQQNAGRYTILWDGSRDDGSIVSSGVFFLRVVTDERHEVRKMLLVK